MFLELPRPVLSSFLSKLLIRNLQKMFMELPGTSCTCLHEIFKFPENVNAKCSWSLLGQFLRFPQQIVTEKLWKMLLELLGLIASGYIIIFFINLWKMLLELSGQIPSHFFIRSLSKNDGKYSESFLGHFPCTDVLNPHQTSTENVPAGSWTNSFKSPYQIVIPNLQKMLRELSGPILINFSFEVSGKWCWSLLGHSFRFPYWIFVESQYKIVLGASWVDSVRFPRD